MALIGLWVVWQQWKFSDKGNGGFYQNGKAGTETDEEGKSDTEDSKSSKSNVSSDEGVIHPTAEEKGERKIVENTNYNEIDNTLYAWWFKRNDNHEKSGCQEDFDISEYNGYYTLPVSRKIIYITFDCGYENGYTADILDTLKKNKVPAAFFVTQTFIRDNIDLVKRMKEEGHLVCNHTVRHPSMPGKSVEEQKNELLECENYMKEATGYEMDLFFRPPKGEYSKRTLQIAKDLGYATIFWSMAYLDYDVNNQPSKEHVVEHFRKYYHPGAIPLMHNVSVANKEALEQVINDLKKEGYSFGTLYDIMNCADAQAGHQFSSKIGDIIYTKE
ncbi:MAG: polysaccharide deacetylase family protein [Lachnospiraceae bacterium]|nr:polysaccharide deacetylase family protein [Lachnospiraceae bacterium]